MIVILTFIMSILDIVIIILINEGAKIATCSCFLGPVYFNNFFDIASIKFKMMKY